MSNLMATKSKSTGTTKTKRSTTRAASTTPKAAANTAPKAKIVSTKTASTSESGGQAGGQSDAPEMTKKEMVGLMVSQSGMKKGDARRALEATMEALATALRAGNNLSLAPLGKIKIARTKDTPNGKMVVLRAKLKEPASETPKDPLAEAAE
ncbi:HU family DNA-binding protein [Litoreibacter halocynthiae]|uniref:HU family DNA-binding protein n=1 Tax=Litoreibacter halocynthiae TaxID=1242689 RepID=UPI0024905155|nr:HU family DNA-binding protein [Litoreibacter halocynthiae]